MYTRLSNDMGVSQNEGCGTGSLPQGPVSRVCFVVCFGGLFRTSPQIERQKCAVCFVVCFEGLFRGSVSPKPNFPALLEVGHPKKIQTDIRRKFK